MATNTSDQGWRETTIRTPDNRLRSMLVEISIDLGWSLDACARRALAWYVERHAAESGMPSREAAKAYALPGGHHAEVSRRKPETLRNSKSKRLSVRYPGQWQGTLNRVIGENLLHNHIAPLWREAILLWIESDDAAEARKAALAA